ncbi:MAG: serine/threonine-protein phosphatase [Anaerolineae bacterium]|nr:serine/threonine-protein phosphatase [Anaerolineae bacterium]
MASDPGTVRSLNEDCVAYMHLQVAQDERREAALLVLADGMGGHAEGEMASQVAVAAALEALAPAALVPLALPAASGGRAGEPLREVLERAMDQADRAVREQTPEGGTTLLLALVVGDQLYLAHVGDSRAYLIREGHAEQLTRDHSLVGRLVELGELSPEQARSHPQRSLLYRALGQGSRLEVDFLSRSLGAGHTLLLCTDGLWSLLSEAELAAHIAAAPTAQAACDALVAEARRRGADDNVSLLVARSVPQATEETA